MILFLMLIWAHAQTGTEPPEIPNSSKEWCLINAQIKDQHIGMVNCTWSEQENPHPLPSIPGKVYHCKNLPGGRTPMGYEGKLTCPSPFGGLDTVYDCARCFTSDNSSGTVDPDCRTSMYDDEKGFCINDAAALDFKHEIGGLLPLPSGPAIPPNPVYTD